MEPSSPLTRNRRKRAHPNKCPCCSEDRGKPEKQPRRRREAIDVEPSSATAGDDRSPSPKRTQVDISNSKLIKAENESGSETGDENSVNKGRVLRSGQSTPVPFEKETCQSKKANLNKVDQKRDFATQKGSKKPKKATGNRDAIKKGKRNLAQESDNFKVDSAKSKVSKMQKYTKGASKSIKAESLSTSSQLSQASDQNISKKVKGKLPRKSIKKTLKRKHVKLPPTHRQSVVKNTLAIDKLKIKAFNNLKEKLEVAFEQRSLTVPECVELCQKITPANLKDILECEMPVMKEKAFKGMSSDDLTDEATESGSEAKAMEKKFAENMNASEAAKALVSFKVQTTAISSASNPSQTSSQELQKSKELKNGLSSQESTVSSANPLKSVDTLTATSAGLTDVPSNQPLKMTGVQATMSSVVLPTAAMPNISMVQAPMTFQLLHVPSQGTKSGELQATPLQQTPSFIYQNPSTMMNKLTPVNQQANGLFPPTLNQLLYLANLKQQHEGKPLLNQNFCGFLPGGMQTQDQVIFSSASGPITSTSLVNTTVSTVCPASTSISATEIQSSTKLRPILPREPLAVPNFPSFAGHGLLQNKSSSTVPKVATQSSNVNVKQEIKRLVSERTKTSNPSTPEVAISPTDIASTFIKTEPNQREVPLVSKCQQEVTEMTSKEQAINALLSIGGNESLSQHRNGETNVLDNRPYETNDTNYLKVVFDTNKGIFKVDDVTIDPLVNTISKESYTCGKCGKIFTSLSYLARHIKRVCPDMSHRKWKCSHCDKAFRHPFGLQQHIYTHTGERPHQCPQCPKAFYSSNDLRRHSRIHSGERPYKCKHCGKSFATTISLKTHTFIHTGEKPHRCPHCVKTFATSSKLGRHIVTHSEQRPYSCKQCPKTFNRSGDLRRHNLHVHNGKLTENPGTSVVVKQEEKIYGCTECSGAFDTSKELEAHINEHTTA